MRTLKYLLFSILAGVLSGLSFYRPELSFLIWFSLALLFFVIKGNSYKPAFFYSYAAGFTHFIIVIFWIGYVTKLGLFLLVLYLSLYWALFAVLSRRFIDSKEAPLVVSFIWVILEYVRTVFGGFGWALFGYSQSRFLQLIQVSDLLGPWPISFLIVYFNAILFGIFDKKNKIILKKHLLLFTVLLLFVLTYGFLSLENKYPSERGLKISIIQPNIPQAKKWDPLFYGDIKDTLGELARISREDSLLILPEASWPHVVNKENQEDLEDFVKRNHRDLVIGVVEQKRNGHYNSSFLMSKNGNIENKYRKINLVPFGEYVPFRKFLSFIEVITNFSDISRGQELVIFPYKGFRMANLICFEDIFPRFVSRFVQKGADILINITNDAWFNGHPQAYQHLQIAVFRAVEQRRYLIRAANTGISCVISAKGEITDSVKAGNNDVFVRGVLTEEVYPVSKITVYNKIGDVFVYIGLIFLLVYTFAATKPQPLVRQHLPFSNHP